MIAHVEYALRSAVRPLGVAAYAAVPQLPDDYKAELPSPVKFPPKSVAVES